MEKRNFISVGISILALVLSAVSFVLSYRLNAASAENALKPVLVFTYDSEAGWILANIGNGPALNVEVAHRKVSGDWFRFIRLPSLASGDEFRAHWLAHSNIRSLGAVYEDIEQRVSTSITQDDNTVIAEGRTLPSNLGNIVPHWQATPVE